MKVRFVLNGEEKSVESCLPSDTLIDTLRDNLGAMSVKRGCDFGGCGMCTVLLSGKPVYSCMMPTWKTEGLTVVTLEGLKKKDVSNIDPVQDAFVKNSAPQCGYCTPAMVLAAKALLDEIPNPTVEQIKDALSGVLCRCTGYSPYVEAIQRAANSRPSDGR